MAIQADTSARTELSSLLGKLRRARQARSALPQHRLAALLAVTEKSLQDWELGRDSPTLAHLVRWSRELGYRLHIDDHEFAPAPATSAARLPASREPDWELLEIARLAEALRDARRCRNVLQAALAEQLGVTRWSVTRWECAQVHPRPLALITWARALDCGVRLLRS